MTSGEIFLSEFKGSVVQESSLCYRFEGMVPGKPTHGGQDAFLECEDCKQGALGVISCTTIDDATEGTTFDCEDAVVFDDKLFFVVQQGIGTYKIQSITMDANGFFGTLSGVLYEETVAAGNTVFWPKIDVVRGYLVIATSKKVYTFDASASLVDSLVCGPGTEPNNPDYNGRDIQTMVAIADHNMFATGGNNNTEPPTFSNGLRLFSVDGSGNITQIDQDTSIYPTEVRSDGTYLYVRLGSVIRAYDVSGGSLALKDSITYGTKGWGPSPDWVFQAELNPITGGYDRIVTYRFNGFSFRQMSILDRPSTGAWDSTGAQDLYGPVMSDPNFVYFSDPAGAGTTNFHVFRVGVGGSLSWVKKCTGDVAWNKMFHWKGKLVRQRQGGDSTEGYRYVYSYDYGA